MRVLRRYIYLLFLVVIGCSAGGVGEMEDYVSTVKARSPRPIEPPPVLRPYQKFSYPVAVQRDPFLPYKPQTVTRNQGLRPDVRRSKESLESFPLDALRMVGTIVQDDKLWALIAAPDGGIVRVSLGNYMGQNFGQVSAITEKEIKVLEIVPEGSGWRQRAASLSLTSGAVEEKKP